MYKRSLPYQGCNDLIQQSQWPWKWRINSQYKNIEMIREKEDMPTNYEVQEQVRKPKIEYCNYNSSNPKGQKASGNYI